MDNLSTTSLIFGEFRLDLREKLLWRGAEKVALPPKVLDVLCLLVEGEGRVVSKNEIMETVWADSFVEESNLTQSIYTLRRILGTDANGRNIIETVPRRGFRIAVPITKAETAAPEKTVLPDAPKPEISFWRRYKTVFVITGSVISAVLLTTLAVNYFYAVKQSPAPIENVSFQRLTFTGNIASPAISPDGKSIVFVKEGNLFLQDANTGSNVQISVLDHKIFGNLRFSPDGESLYFRNERSTTAGGDFFQVSRFGGAARRILENVWSGLGFAPDGKRVGFVRYYPTVAKWVLYVKNLETGEERPLMEKDPPNTIFRTGFPDWSPDGRRLVTVAQEKPVSVIYVIDVETGRQEKLETPRFVQIEQTLWSANGTGIIIVGREKGRFFQLWRMSYPTGELSRITNDLNIYRGIMRSADGKSLIAVQQAFFSHLWVAPADDLENQRQLTSGNLNRDGNVGLDWTPDGNLVYASRITGDIDLFALRLNDNQSRQLTQNAGLNNENPVISPDGQFIYFESSRTGKRHIWRSQANGENPTQMTFSEKEEEFYPALAPDGNRLYYLQKDPRGNYIARKSLTDGQIEKITEQGKLAPESFVGMSPDGGKLAFENIKDGNREETEKLTTEIGVVYLNEQNRVQIYNYPRGSGNFSWTADGLGLEFTQGNKILRRKLDEPESEPQTVLQVQKNLIYNFAWSPDRKFLAIARGRQDRDIILLKNFE